MDTMTMSYIRIPPYYILLFAQFSGSAVQSLTEYCVCIFKQTQKCKDLKIFFW